MITIFCQIPQKAIQEESSFTATALFRLVDASTVPTTVRYRVDDTLTGKAIRAWTDLTPAASIAFTLTPADNAIVTNSRREERRQLTIEINTDLDTQTRERFYWTIKTIDEF